MKTQFKTLLFLLFGISAHSQTLSPNVIVSGGGYFSGGGASLSWTMGETFYKTLTNPNKMLTQGFQQPYFPLKTLHLKLFIDGFYSGGGFMQKGGAGCLNILEISEPMYSSNPEDVDDMTITAMDAINYLPVESQVGRLKTNGNVTVTFMGAATAGNNYYIQLTHRNLVETWSKNPVPLTVVTSYDFTVASTQAYDEGQLPMNEVEPGVWACFNGDIDHDGAVTSLDMTLEENDTNLGLYGYRLTDLDGDGASTSLDMTIIENNTNIGVYSAHP
jgi:hypothetical protein